MWANLKQLVYPKEFRIEPGNGLTPDVLVRVDNLSQLLEKNAREPQPGNDDAAVELAIAWWEARKRSKRMEELLGAEEPGFGPHVRRMKDILKQMEQRVIKEMGIEIIDIEGEVWNKDDYRFEVLGGESVSGISHPFVASTLKPAVIRHGSFLQMGKILVNSPEEDGDEADH